MSKTKRRSPTWLSRLKNAPVLIAVAVLASGATSLAIVHADTFQQQIDNLSAQNAQNQSTVNNLQIQANSYQDAINKLQQEIGGLQAEITANQARQAQLQAQIVADQAQLDQEKHVLGEDLKAMYVNGQMSTVEMLATSKNLSAFVDAETYGTAVQNKIQDTLNQIAQLQSELEAQENQLTKLLASQQQQEASLSAARAQQSNLLSLNQTQQDAYTKQIKANNSRISQLQQEQAAAERAAFSGSSSPTGGIITFRGLTNQQMCGGAYNFHCADIQDQYIDQWGEYNRECVSYAAWYEATHGHYVPDFGSTSQGNASQWHSVLAATGTADIIYYDQAIANEGALAGDIVYMPIGGLGHVGAVLYDEGNGWVRVGQYNIYEEGMYSEMDLKITPNLEFYHFH